MSAAARPGFSRTACRAVLGGSIGQMVIHIQPTKMAAAAIQPSRIAMVQLRATATAPPTRTPTRIATPRRTGAPGPRLRAPRGWNKPADPRCAGSSGDDVSDMPVGFPARRSVIPPRGHISRERWACWDEEKLWRVVVPVGSLRGGGGSLGGHRWRQREDRQPSINPTCPATGADRPGRSRPRYVPGAEGGGCLDVRAGLEQRPRWVEAGHGSGCGTVGGGVGRVSPAGPVRVHPAGSPAGPRGGRPHPGGDRGGRVPVGRAGLCRVG